MHRYRFSDFTLSPQRRLLLRQGEEVPIIPRYFDLLLLLVERRHEAVHRRDIFDRVWADGIVSDSALTQAIRTLRRTLGDDDPREPRFIRTVSRHGYQFVFPDVTEEEEETPAQSSGARPDLPTRLPWPGMAAAGAAGGALAGLAAGGAGGLILSLAPDSYAPLALAPVLAVIGAACGAVGGCGVGAGLGIVESRTTRNRGLTLTAAGALGGGLVGAAVQWLARWALSGLVGLDLSIGGGLEGLVIGAGAGGGIALATLPSPAGPATPPGRTRVQVALITAIFCGVAALTLALAGWPLAGGTIHAIADAADGSRATLAPLGRLIGEPDFGLVSSAILAFGEGATFGFGLTLGLLRRTQAAGTPARLHSDT